MKLATTDEPVNLIGTPPSSDSGMHSWGEQWENMSTSTTDIEAEQNGTPTIGIPMGRRVSHTCVPPNTEEDQVILCPWMDCLLNRESDEASSIGTISRNYIEETQESVDMDIHSKWDLTSDESPWEDYDGGTGVPLTVIQRTLSGKIPVRGQFAWRTGERGMRTMYIIRRKC